MSKYSIQMRKKNGALWDLIYPITLAKNVQSDNGMNLQEVLDTLSDGDGNGGAIAFEKNSVKITYNTSVVKMGFSYNENTDTLLTFANSQYLEIDEDYVISAEKDSIIIVGNELIASTENPIYFNFVLFRAIPMADAIIPGENIENGSIELSKLSYEIRTILEGKTPVTVLTYSLSIRSNSHIVPIDYDFIYSDTTDDVIGFYNGNYMELNTDYAIDIENRQLINLNGEWEATDSEPATLSFILLLNNKSASGGSVPVEVRQDIAKMKLEIETLRQLVVQQKSFIENLFDYE